MAAILSMRVRRKARSARISARLVALSTKKVWSSRSGSVPEAGFPRGVCAGRSIIRERSEGVGCKGGGLFTWITIYIMGVVVRWMGGVMEGGGEEGANI
jgi:hypothetical protein